MMLWYRIKDVFRNLKWRCQRFKRGYADVDAWDIFTWFTTNLEQMLEDLAISHHGFPVGFDKLFNNDNELFHNDDERDRKWTNMLYEMASCLRFMRNFHKEYVVVDREECERRYAEYCRIKKRFFDMFEENIEELWD